MPATLRRAPMISCGRPPGLAGALLGCVFALATVVGTAVATDPQIDFIERYGTNRVTIHFNTDANRTYTLQYSSATNAGVWSNLATVPAEPFPNHYVLVASASNAFGLFRLAVTP